MTDPNDLDDLDALLDEAVDMMDAQEKVDNEKEKERQAKLDEDIRKALSEQEAASNAGGAADFSALLQSLMAAGADGNPGDDFFDKFKHDVNALVSSLEGTPGLEDGDVANLARVKELMSVMETDDEDKVREVVEKLEKEGELNTEGGDAEVDAALQRCMAAVSELEGQSAAAGNTPAGAAPSPAGQTKEPTEEELKEQLKAAADAAALMSDDGSPEGVASLLFEALLNPEFVEPIKIMRDAYGPFFDEKGSEISAEDKVRYGNQHKKTVEICEFLAVPIDKEDGERVTKLLDLMHEFAELGEPPKELANYTKKSE